MWNIPRPGIEPMSPTLAGRFLTTGSPGKSLIFFYYRGLSQELRSIERKWFFLPYTYRLLTSFLHWGLSSSRQLFGTRPTKLLLKVSHVWNSHLVHRTYPLYSFQQTGASSKLELWWIPIQSSFLHSAMETRSHQQSLPVVVLGFESNVSLLYPPNSRGHLTSSSSCDLEAPLLKLEVRGRHPLPSAHRIIGHQNCLSTSFPNLQNPHNFISLMWVRFRYLSAWVILVSQLTLQCGMFPLNLY